MKSIYSFVKYLFTIKKNDMKNEKFYVIGNEDELYDDYNEALVAAIPDVTHPSGLQAEVQLLELTYEDANFEEACEEAGIVLYEEDEDDITVWVVAEFSRYSMVYEIRSAYDDEADAEESFHQLIALKYADRLCVYEPKYTYADREAGNQDVSFDKLSELIAYIEEFGYHGDSDGRVFFGNDEIFGYESREDGITWVSL